MVRRETTQYRHRQHRHWTERVRRGALLAVLIAANMVATAPAHQARAQSLQANPPQLAQSQFALPHQYAQSQYARSRRLPPLRELVVQYRELALRAEFGGEARRGRIIKWAGPIIAELRGKNLDVYEPEVLHHMALLTRLTRLQFHTVRASRHDAFSAGPKPNMIITFVHNGGRGPRNLEHVCYARVFSGRDFIIRRAEIRIHADWNLLRRHCILEELTQALGLMNDSSYFNPSIFNDHSKQQALSPWDRLMVRAHYDRRLMPGMTWIYAEPIVRDHFRSYLAALYRPAAKHRKVRKRKRRR
jgi:hypothetical protein